MTLPDNLNGHPVIRIEQHTNCSTVLVQGHGEYIVATWWPDLKKSWSWGHYFTGDDALDDASADFKETAKRNANR